MMMDDIDDILKAIKDINKLFDGENGINNKLFDINGLVNQITKGIANGNPEDIQIEVSMGEPNGWSQLFPQSGNNDETNIVDIQRNKEKEKYNKNILLIGKILELCKQKEIFKIFNSKTISLAENNKILVNNKVEDNRIFKIVELYNIDLRKITNIKKFLECIKYALDKNELRI